MPTRHKQIFAFALPFAICLFLIGCGFGEVVEPTPFPTVTPPSDMLTLRTTQFSHDLQENQRVPGTQIVYRSAEGDNINVEIDGQPSVRRVGDVLNGYSLLVPGVYGDYNLRLMTGAFSGPRVVGDVVTTIFDPSPSELFISSPPAANFMYEGISVDYRVPVNRALPGSTVIYLGQDNGVARLSGTAQYANLPEGNSFVWTGQIRPNAIIQYDLKAVAVTQDELRMVGTARLFLYAQAISGQ